MSTTKHGWYYKQTEKSPPLYTVGYGEDDRGRFVQTDSDHSTREAAADRVHYLNGGTKLTPTQDAAPELLSALQALFRQTVTLRLPPDANCLQMVASALAKAEGRS